MTGPWIVAIALVLGGAAQLLVTSRTASGRLGRNKFAGVRTRATMLTDENWLAAHQAARPLGMRSGQAFLASGLVVPAARVGQLLALAGVGFGIVCLYLSTRAAVRAVTPIARSENSEPNR